MIRGNHDKVAAGISSMEDFNSLARRAAIWTRGILTDENLEWVKNLPVGPADAGGYQIAHGSPADEDEYLLQEYEVRHSFEVASAPLTFFGHTHLQGGFCLHKRRVIRLAPVRADEVEYTFELAPDDLYLVNPGSVGQPRDGDWRAGAAIHDHESRAVTLVRVAYDLETAQRKICAAGLPVPLALRLAAGT